MELNRMNSKSTDRTKSLRTSRRGNEQNQTNDPLLQSTPPQQQINVDRDGNTDLHTAARSSGNETSVAQLISNRSKNVLLTTPNNMKWLPLHFAVENNNVSIASLLVNAMNVNDLNSKCSYELRDDESNNVKSMSWTALHIAVFRGHVECIRLLSKADFQIPDERGYNPVHLAADFRDNGENLMGTLLQVFPSLRNEKLDVQTADGLTPLMLSARKGNHALVGTLIEYKADIGVSIDVSSEEKEISVRDEQTSRNGQNLLHIVVRKYAEKPNDAEKYRQVLKTIFGDNGNTNKLRDIIDKKGKCSLKPHVERDDLSVVEFGAAVGAVNLIMDMTEIFLGDNRYVKVLVDCLHAAARYGRPEVISSVLGVMQPSADLSSHLNDKRLYALQFDAHENWTALHVAVFWGHIECIKVLNPLDSLMVDDRDNLPLHLAADSRSSCMLDVFLSTFSLRNDKQLDQLNSDGYTPLMMCAILGNVDGFSKLVEYGADVEKVIPKPSDDYEKATFGERAGQNVVHIIVKMSAEKPNNVAQFLEIYRLVTQPYVKKKRIQTMNDNLLQKKATCCYPERFDEKSMTPMQYAAAVGAADLLDAMVDSLIIEKNCDLALRYLIPTLTDCTSGSEFISYYCTLGEMVQMERIQPLTKFAVKFARLRTAAFTLLLLFHITHMTMLTEFTTSVRNWTDSNSSSENNITSGCPHSVQHNNFRFIVWPSLLLSYEIFCLLSFVVHVLCPSTSRPSLADRLRELKSTLSSTTESQFRITYLDATAHISAIVFVVLMYAWYFTGEPNADECVFNARRNVSLSATVLVWGWMLTLEYIRYPAKVHTFVAILKLIFIKDVLYIVFIYAFVLFGFAAAIFVYLLADPSHVTSMTFWDCVYHVYTTMLGDGELFENAAITASNSHRIRSVFAVYLCLSIIVLLNMLIAMMNNRYANVLDIRRSLWYIETINSIAWFGNILPFKCCSSVNCCCRCVFEWLAKRIKKPVGAEPIEDGLSKLCSRIDAIEASLEQIRNKLEIKFDNPPKSNGSSQ